MRFAPVLVRLDGWGSFRSLRPDDVEALGDFYNGLSQRSREFWHRHPDGAALAKQHCDDIDRYDKLRLILEHSAKIAAVFELSFSIPQGDQERFAAYGQSLSEATDVRFGPCVLDSVHGSGLAPVLLRHTAAIARREGRRRLVLWGGVQIENERARRFYLREGFVEVGRTADLVDMVRPA